MSPKAKTLFQGLSLSLKVADFFIWKLYNIEITMKLRLKIITSQRKTAVIHVGAEEVWSSK